LTNKKLEYTFKTKKTTTKNIYNYHNKKTSSLNRDPKTNLDPTKNILPHYPQLHHNIHETHSYKNNTHIKNVYQNLSETLIPHLNQTNNNTYTHHTQIYTIPTIPRKTPSYVFFNKKLILRCGDIKKKPRSKIHPPSKSPTNTPRKTQYILLQKYHPNKN
jgi:hypothetical protein